MMQHMDRMDTPMNAGSPKVWRLHVATKVKIKTQEQHRKNFHRATGSLSARIVPILTG